MNSRYSATDNTEHTSAVRNCPPTDGHAGDAHRRQAAQERLQRVADDQGGRDADADQRAPHRFTWQAGTNTSGLNAGADGRVGKGVLDTLGTPGGYMGDTSLPSISMGVLHGWDDLSKASVYAR